VRIDEHTHPVFEKCVKLASARAERPVQRPGRLRQVAPRRADRARHEARIGALHCSAGASESQLFGWLLPTGEGGRFEYVAAQFARMFAEGQGAVPDRRARRGRSQFPHGAERRAGERASTRAAELEAAERGPWRGFHIMAAANTYGTGADALYVGRNQLDAATLDRFYVVEMDYDRKLEAKLAPKEVCEWAWKLRERAAAAKLRRVVSTRTIQRVGAALRAGFDMKRRRPTRWRLDARRTGEGRRAPRRGRRRGNARPEAPAPEQPTAPHAPRHDAPSRPVSTEEELVNLPGIKGRAWHVRHDSVEAFITAPVHPMNEHLAAREWEGGNDDWRFGEARNKQTFISRVRDGWPEGAARLSEIAATHLGRPVSVRRVRKWADNGDTVEMSRVWAGRVDVAWQRCERQSRTAPRVVRLVPFIGGAAKQNESQFFYRGAAMARLSDALSEAGYNVEIVAACVGHGLGEKREDEHYAHALTLKPATAPLDLSNLAAVICQVGFFRYYTFRSMAGAPLPIRTHFCWYGDKDGLNELARATVPLEPGVITFYLPYEVDTRAAAEQWVNDCIRKIDGGGEQQLAA
jgi:hypothetical protein